MIELTDVTKVFTLTRDQRKIVGKSELRPKLFTAVDSINLKCDPSKVFALIGPNGSGKTTTLRMISTMISPTSGSIQINGSDVLVDGRSARKSIGFMTNQTALYDRLSPYEMVKYFADLNSMDRIVFDQRCKEIFDRLDMNRLITFTQQIIFFELFFIYSCYRIYKSKPKRPWKIITIVKT